MSDLMDSGEENIIDESMNEALSRRYLAYALSTITSRALPDVRDGLKPVQRRILYAMRELKLNPDASYRKCAKIVGEVMGNYHPHGDSAIYDTLVRLAQSFSVRYPLVDGQGNFGNIDGDSAAAMRYTESRMTAAAKLLLDGLDENAVDFRDTYDEQDSEPVVLPAAYPNLLANGATGIAVGMATSIPPHNAAELIDACLILVDNKNAELDELLEVMPGPDFPTGGTLVESKETIREAYATGRGGFRIRAKWEKEDLGRGTWQIVVTEIPFQVQKGKLIERLAELIDAKKVPLLGDVRDESAEDIRLVLEPKSKTVDPDMLMESLYKLSDLESRFSMNLNVLDKGAPKVMNLKEVLMAYLSHRQEVVVRIAQHQLDKTLARLEVLEGYLVAFLNLDEVIRIIREEDHPKSELMKAFNLTENQAEAILNMRLRSLRKLEEMEIRGEHAELEKKRDKLEALIKSPAKQWKEVAKGLNEARKVFDPETELGRRRSIFGEAPAADVGDMIAEALIVREPITVVLSEQGWIRALKGHNNDLEKVKFKDGDGLALSCQMETTDKLILMSSDGRAFTLGGDKLPGGRGAGEPIRFQIDLEDEHSITDMFRLNPEGKRFMASKAGYGFICQEADLVSARKAGKQVVTTSSDSPLFISKVAVGDKVAVIGDNRKLLIFDLADLPEMPRGKGVKLQSYKDGGLLDAMVFSEADGFVVTEASGRQRTFPDWQEWNGRRAGAGRMVMRGFPRSGKFDG
ncbi:DNA topoisomerase IV subunit A [Ponticaulis sp.]|uniref:DNA topoisomerase IV subunit A n=1 Tax=Ponticaulis sp. TaxID=2020902 RepID=UPI00260D5B39|nr:DNA topoisomerase IV subunit A [Ponticaulis sp.]MDF1681751.1 DNA topoisomerase IV subunit A [Ponticaulis sp.]